MKRKFITLLFAFVAIAAFQVNGQTKPFGADVAKYATKANYAYPKDQTVFDRFLNDAGATPWIKAGSNDVPVNIQVAGGTNQIKILDGSSNPLTLTYTDPVLGAQTVDAFVLFRNGTSNAFVVQTFDGTQKGQQGYLSVNTAEKTTDSKLLIVFVKTSDGSLELHPLSWYDTAANNAAYVPLYIRTHFYGHWATIDDFTCPDGSKYFRLKLADGSYLTVDGINAFAAKQIDYIAKGTVAQTGNNIIDGSTNVVAWTGSDVPNAGRFALGTYDDPIVGDSIIPLFAFASPQNDCDVISVSRENDLKTQDQYDGGYANKLELRKFATYKEYSLKSGKTAGSWTKTDYNESAVDANLGTPDEYRAYTSLQKFAVWVSADGEYTLFPAASYYWRYGDSKYAQTDDVRLNAVLKYNNPDIVGVTGIADSYWGVEIDKWLGYVPSHTSANVTPYVATGPASLQSVTAYEEQLYTLDCVNSDCDFDSKKWYFIEIADSEKLIKSDTTGLWLAMYTQIRGPLASLPLGGSTTLSKTNYYYNSLGWKSGQFQYNRDYVLSLQRNNDQDSMILVVLPKEKVRQYKSTPSASGLSKDPTYAQLEGFKTKDKVLDDYWANNPYDSVNMAAHWSINKQADGTFILVNMLGDTLQYNYDCGSGAPNSGVSGYYTAQKSIASGYFTQGYDISTKINGTDPTLWYPANTDPAWSNDTQANWTINTIPGNCDEFFLSLGGCADGTINLVGDDVTTVSSGGYTYNGWYQGLVRANRDSLDNFGVYDPTKYAYDALYWQKDLMVYQEIPGTLVGQGDPLPACAGLRLKTTPIYYVPTFAGSYGTEADNDVINTNDDKYYDGLVMEKDSLDAYLWLHGDYALLEALAVSNGLYFTNENNEYPAYGTPARLKSPNPAYQYKFTPLDESDDVLEAYSKIDAAFSTPYSDNLAGETYKWFIVKYGDQYLTYDTINPTATDKNLVLGLTFQTTDAANALPVRLYQPLVGDKIDANFLFQFYPRQYTYYKSGTTYTRVANSSYYAAANGPVSPNQVYFGQLVNQSQYIIATDDKAKATRFTYEFKEGVPSECCPKFVAPKWLADNRLLGMPQDAQVYFGGAPTDGYMGLGATALYKTTNAAPTTSANRNIDIYEAVVAFNAGETQTKVEHTYATSILPGAVGTLAIPSGLGAGGTATTVANAGGTGTGWQTAYGQTIGTNAYAPNKDAFYGEREVPLYYVQNADGRYLSVSGLTDQKSAVTTTDVTGVKLTWDTLYTKTGGNIEARDYIKGNYDKRALQLFAIYGCDEANGAGEELTYGEFVYLPLASYLVDYATGKVDSTGIIYNIGLGKAGTERCTDNADITPAWRVAEWSKPATSKQNLIVASSRGLGDINSNIVPVEFMWKPAQYPFEPCHHSLVKHAGSAKAAQGNKFYAINGLVSTADASTIRAHWAIEKVDPDNADDYSWKFVNELEGYPIYQRDPAKFSNTSGYLKGEYIFVPDGKNYIAYDFTTATAANSWKVTKDTLTITCVDHESQYLKLRNSQVLDPGLFALEVPYFDRNINYQYRDGNGALKTTPIYKSSKLIGYDTYHLEVNDKADPTSESLPIKAYPTNVRYMSDLAAEDGEYGNHDIPYYLFSTEIDGVEYFLAYVATTKGDSLYWYDPTKDFGITKKEFLDAAVSNWEDDPDYAWNYKWCLPIRPDFECSAPYAGEKAVFIQTWDKETDLPYLVSVTGASSHDKVYSLKDAILNFSQTEWDGYGLYNIDYKYIDFYHATSYVFGGELKSGDQWLPVKEDDGTIGSNYSLLSTANVNLVGNIVWESGYTNPNYAIFSNGDKKLYFQFEGDTVIGPKYQQFPIWYYRILIKADGQDSKYLTDTRPEGTYKYTFSGNTYDIANFGAVSDTSATMKAEGITADSKLAQTFGLKQAGMVDVDGVSTNVFYVVSNANYKNTSDPEGDYRYLAQINERLVFIPRPAGDDWNQVLKFVLGKYVGGKFTDVKVIASGIYGVAGGVKLSGISGKVDLYTIDGTLIKSAVLSGGEQTIAAPKGAVIVKTGTTVAKVIVL
jgi:hypothetical protein